MREFHIKSFIAVNLARVGYTVKIIPKDMFNERLHELKPGIVLQFGLNQSFLKSYLEMKRLGFKIVTYDEEGFVTLDKDQYLKDRVSIDTSNVVDQVWTWGPRQAGWIEEFFTENNIKTPVREVGSVAFGEKTRLDYEGLFKEEVIRLKKEHGAFILVSGSFGTVNHHNGDQYYWSGLKDKGWLDDPINLEYHKQRYNTQKKNFEKLKEILIELQHQHKIIVRPHPSENLEHWESWAKNNSECGQIKVIRDGFSTPWILAAESLIHCGCTNAVEASIRGTPSIIIAEEKDIPYISKITYDCSFKATTDVIDNIRSHSSLPVNLKKLISEHNTINSILTALTFLQNDPIIQQEKPKKLRSKVKSVLRGVKNMASAKHSYSRLKCAPFTSVQKNFVLRLMSPESRVTLKRGVITIDRK